MRLKVLCMILPCVVAFSGAVQGQLLVAVRGDTLPGHGKIAEYSYDGSLINASLITGLTNPGCIAISGSLLFVTNPQAGTVGEYTTSGTPVNPSLITGLAQPYGIAVSGTDLFVANSSSSGWVGKYTISGATINSRLINGLRYPTGIVTDGANLYVTEGERVGKYTTSGGAVNPALITGVNPGTIVLAGSSLFFADGNNNYVSEYTTSGVLVKADRIPLSYYANGLAITDAADGSAVFTASAGVHSSWVDKYHSDGSDWTPNLIRAVDTAGGLAVLNPAPIDPPVPEPSLTALAFGALALFRRPSRP